MFEHKKSTMTAWPVPSKWYKFSVKSTDKSYSIISGDITDLKITASGIMKLPAGMHAIFAFADFDAAEKTEGPYVIYLKEQHAIQLPDKKSFEQLDLYVLIR